MAELMVLRTVEESVVMMGPWTVHSLELLTEE